MPRLPAVQLAFFIQKPMEMGVDACTRTEDINSAHIMGQLKATQLLSLSPRTTTTIKFPTHSRLLCINIKTRGTPFQQPLLLKAKRITKAK
jgi:hypothetical protein